MQRHRALIPLSHDHQHALVAARRLRRAAGGADAETAAAAFVRFFADQSLRHFRDEEERLFPLAVDLDEARPGIVRALVEHQQLHALAGRLAGGETAEMRELADLLEAHVRYEERELFPLFERLLGDRLSAELGRATASKGRGPVWGAESEDLNATLLVWDPGEGPPEHVNDERDVLLVVLDGSLELRVGGESAELAEGEITIVAKGRRRKITAGESGVRYLSVHRRRPPLQIASASASESALSD